MGFSYPLTFENEEDHIRHVVNNNTFYKEVLMKGGLSGKHIKQTTKDEDEESEKERKKNADELMAERARDLKQEQKKVEEEKKKVEQQQKEVEEEKKKVEQQQKEVKEEKMKVEKEQKKVEDEKKEVEKRKEQVENADRLLTRKEKNDAVESSAKGNTFEEEIIYKLKTTINRNGDLGFEIDDNNKTKACDIRLKYRELVIGIEAKDKNTITKEDIFKFDRDRNSNNFAGAIFWSKKSKIHGGEDTGRGDYYFNISNDKCLFLRGEDFDRSVYIIFTYAKFLFLMKNQESPSQDMSDMILEMFNMISLQYTQFGKLKKEVQTLDVMFKKNLEMIDHMCEKNHLKPPKKNFKLKESTLVVVPFGDALSTKVYENKELEVLKSKKPSQFFDRRKKRKSDESNGDLHSSPNKTTFPTSSVANGKLGNESGGQSSPIKVGSDDERDE